MSAQRGWLAPFLRSCLKCLETPLVLALPQEVPRHDVHLLTDPSGLCRACWQPLPGLLVHA